MTISMMKYIDVLTPHISSCPWFIVDITQKFVTIHTGRGVLGVWGETGLLTQFQNRDNIKVLSIGIFMPENFAFTIRDFPLYNNQFGNPAPAATLRYTALYTRTDANGVWISGHLYEAVVGAWIDQDAASQSPQLQLSLANSDTVYLADSFLPGYGCSNNGVFVLPFPNYELVLDLYSDIANNLLTEVPSDEFFVWHTTRCPAVSMVGVPSDLDGQMMRIIPFVKIAHTCPIIAAAVPPAPPEPPIADFKWRDHNWEEDEDPHGDAYHNDPISFPPGPPVE